MVHLSSIRNPASRPKLRGGFFIILLILALSVGPVSFVFATEEAPRPAPAPALPEVLVFIVGVMPPYDHVSINYTGVVSEDQVKKDLKALNDAAKWQMNGVRITTASTGTPGAKPTTQASFETAPLANSVDGTLPLAPFVTALKRFDVIEVHYILPSEFPFKGLKNYRDRYVNVKMNQVSNAYKYWVNITDSSFENLSLPLTQPVEKAAPERGSTPTGARVLLIGGIALVGSILAYVLTMMFTNRRRAA